MNDALSIYIHIPYCASKCSYCDFFSLAGSDDTIQNYFDALKKEIKHSYASLDKRGIDTIYIGGGTPSYVNEKYIADTLDCVCDVFHLSENCEISIESNPNSLSKQKCISYKHSGVNRISLGVQAIRNSTLKRIGRIHTFEDIQKAVSNIKDTGFDNFNFDLMASLPLQGKDEFTKALEWCVSSKPSHISAYSLTLEKGTKMYDEYESGKYTQNDDIDRQMYALTNEILSKHGFYRYEISNYALKGYECRHNLNCWNFSDYIGFGSAACSFYNNKRIQNENDIISYINRINNGIYLTDSSLIEQSPPNVLYSEYMMLGLRKTSGVNIKDFCERFNTPFPKKFSSQAKLFEKEGLVSCENGKIALSDRGLDFANYVMRGFFD